MRFVIINSLMRTTKRLRDRFKIKLQPPAENSGPKRKDKTGLIFFLLAISLVAAVVFLA